MADVKLSSKTRKSVCMRSMLLQGSWNYERMQNAGFAYAMMPAIKELYKDDKEAQIEATKRHLEFFNTQPFCASPIFGVVLALEEEKANGAEVPEEAISSVKVGMMGPLAGVGDPVFWFTIRPILGALGASLALSGNIMGPLLFFIVFNALRIGFMWFTQEYGYKVGSKIAEDLSGGLLRKISEIASILGMFVIGGLVERWVSITFKLKVSEVTQSAGAFIDWDNLKSGTEGLKEALTTYDSIGSTALNQIKTTTLQNNLDSLIPGLAALLLTLLCCSLLKKKVSPIVIILCLFVVGIAGVAVGLL